MNETLCTIVAGLMVAAGVAAEANLARVFVRDWLRGRKERRDALAGLKGRRRGSPAKGAGRARGSHAAHAAVMVPVVFAGAALGQRADSQPTAPPTAPAPASPAPLLSFQPQTATEPAPPPTPPPPSTSGPLTISTNRPSFNDTTGIVPIGHFQLETGYTFTFRDRGGVETQTHNAPELLARVPLLEERLELQLGTSGYVWSRSDDGSGFASTQGFSDATVGLRLKVADEDGWLPRLALQASTTVGLGSKAISNRDAEPTVKLIWSYDLGDGWGVYGNLGAAYLTSDGDRFLQGQAGVCVSKTLTEQWSVFTEYYVFGPSAKGADAAHYLQAGAGYLLTPRVQLDARVGFGLNGEANNLIVGAGISFLF